MAEISVAEYQAAENNSSRRKSLLADKDTIINNVKQFLATGVVAHGEATLPADRQALLDMKALLITELTAILK